MRKPSDTRSWLDRRFARREDGYYYAHQPIYGFGSPHSEPGHLRRLARTLNLLLALSRLEFATFLDVGAGEGYLTTLIQRTLGSRGVALEVSLEAAHRARELFGLPAVVADAHELPFPDDSFDLAIASEVVEHVEQPWQVADELKRVARKYVVITTEEFCADEKEQALMLKLRDFTKPHTERNFFIAHDLRSMLGDDIELRAQFRNHLPHEEGRMRIEDARRVISRIAQVDEPAQQTKGVIAIARLRGAEARNSPRLHREEVLDSLLKPLIDSPSVAPPVKPLPWPQDAPQPTCQTEDCKARGKPGEECDHLIQHPDGIYEYAPPEAEVEAPPQWAVKFSAGNTASGAERRKLSRLLRRRQRGELLGAPEPIAFKLAWFAVRAWRKLLRLFAC